MDTPTRLDEVMTTFNIGDVVEYVGQDYGRIGVGRVTHVYDDMQYSYRVFFQSYPNGNLLCRTDELEHYTPPVYQPSDHWLNTLTLN